MALPKKMVKSKGASVITGLEERTLARRRRLGLPPKYYRFGKTTVRYDLEDLEKFLADHVSNPKEEKQND
jgi:hypothetical protein